MTPLDHPDNRGVWVELWAVDLLDGDHAAALLLSQLLWWHQPGKDGRPKVTYERNGSTWLLRPDDGWEDCRLSQKQVRRIRSVLVAKGLIEHKRFKLNGAPTSAWRPLFDAIQDAIRPNPELPLEGQFQGSDPQGAVGSDPQGAVPIPSPPSRDLPREQQLPSIDYFAAFWKVYPRKTEKGAARKAWDKAVKAAGGDPDRIVQGAYRYALDPNRVDEYTKTPPRWLNAECWDDDPLPARGSPVNGTPRLSNVEKSWRNIQEALG